MEQESYVIDISDDKSVCTKANLIERINKFINFHKNYGYAFSTEDLKESYLKNNLLSTIKKDLKKNNIKLLSIDYFIKNRKSFNTIHNYSICDLQVIQDSDGIKYIVFKEEPIRKYKIINASIKKDIILAIYNVMVNDVVSYNFKTRLIKENISILKSKMNSWYLLEEKNNLIVNQENFVSCPKLILYKIEGFVFDRKTCNINITEKSILYMGSEKPLSIIGTTVVENLEEYKEKLSKYYIYRDNGNLEEMSDRFCEIMDEFNNKVKKNIKGISSIKSLPILTV